MKGLVAIKKQVFGKIEEIIVLESIEDFKIEYNEDGSRKISGNSSAIFFALTFVIMLCTCRSRFFCSDEGGGSFTIARYSAYGRVCRFCRNDKMFFMYEDDEQ